MRTFFGEIHLKVLEIDICKEINGNHCIEKSDIILKLTHASVDSLVILSDLLDLDTLISLEFRDLGQGLLEAGIARLELALEVLLVAILFRCQERQGETQAP